MKKNIKIGIICFILGAIVFSGITVLATTIFARDVTYGNTNVESALNDLYDKANANGNIKLLKFNNENISASYYVVPDNFVTIQGEDWTHSKSMINYDFNSNEDFEISADIIYKDSSVNLMGGININFYFDNNIIGQICLQDGWSGLLKSYLEFNLNNKEYNNQITCSDCSGKYSIVRNNNILSFYQNNTLLNSIEFNENVRFNKIEIDFLKYPGYNMLDTFIKNIYIGNVKNY